MAFIFVLIGYGTKAGVAPMHTWLPDAHAEAPTPISAVLSGLMLNLALYAVLRVKSIVDPAVGPAFTGAVMLGLGLLSMAIAAAFMLIQRDYKRLLAYSSIEHVGITLVGFGVGGPVGVFAGFFHMLNHALAKSTAFYAAGMVLLRHGHKVIDRVTGLLRQTPAVGAGLLAAAVALAGLPPFGLFTSELLIAAASYREAPWVAVLFLALLALAFAALVAHLSGMVLGEPTAEVHTVGGRPHHLMLSAMVINVIAMSAIGLFMPDFLQQLFHPMAALFQATAELP
jgi:hydrogenase-4 component F